MRTLKNLKYLLVVLALPVLMSGCLKTEDPNFTCSGGGYMYQKNIGGTPYYAVYLNLTANEVLKKAEYYTDSPYMPTALSQVYNTGIWEISERYMSWKTALPNGTYNFIATNGNAETTTTSAIFNIDKSLGEIDLKKFEIKGGDISMELNKEVENATGYYLMFTVGTKSSEDALPEFRRCYSNYYLWSERSSQQLVMSASLDLKDVINRASNGYVTLQDDDIVYVAFAAVRATSSGALIQETPYRSITIKSETNLLE